ncbi:MAG: DEAD/DEAH box helicase [Deltaproteobacteria bacterium]|nr:DEAD/DEAH box helicase [Deltaproteobacteria bacterium]
MKDDDPTRVLGRQRPEQRARREQLREAIDQEEVRLATLEAEQADSRCRLAALRADVASLGAEPQIRVHPPLAIDAPVPRTPADKVKLFRSLFRGREDVFPTRFVSKKTGKPGYAPACRNKFVRGVCELPKVKCGECPNQAFAPFDDAAVAGHLTGRHVMGVYPLLEDETSWLLAVDFDKSTWIEDVRAFVETCRGVGLPTAVERSRSGHGAHVWFFFAAPVAASTSRKMGCYLITETMSRRHQLSMDSYDRLFPSQDTMPRGGFGNLIALPLQREARKAGNSVFLDDELKPYPDDQQWVYLSSVPRIDPAAVETIAREATRQGSVVGVRLAESADEDGATPWARLPSRKPKPVILTEPVPPMVRAVLAQKLFVDKAGLPSPLINEIKRLAAFQNPEFYKKQSMRLSTATTPRVIACAEDLPHHVGLPRGRQTEVQGLLGRYGASLDVEDRRTSGEPVGFRFQGTLTAVQMSAVAALLGHDIGVFVAPPGVGKTVVGTYMVAARGCSTLVLVHRRPLLDQWLAQLSLFLGIEPKEIGQIGAGRKTGNGKLDVAMIQSLCRNGKVQDLVANYGQIIVDECHHLPAVSFERVLAEARARYVVGLTATPQRRDGHDPIAEMQLGPVRFAVDPKSQAAQRPFAHTLVVRETGFTTSREKTSSIQELYAALAADEQRNHLILNDVVQALEQGRSPIVLTERKDHLEYFAEQLRKLTRHLVVLHGGMGTRERRAVQERLAAIPDAAERLVLATGRYIGEGFDDARLNTLFLALPVSWKGTLIQYTGRLHRLHSAKREVRIFDYVDREIPMLLRMFERRLRGYRGIGYARGEAPLGYAELRDELVVEYDEEVLRSLQERDDFT